MGKRPRDKTGDHARAKNTKKKKKTSSVTMASQARGENCKDAADKKLITVKVDTTTADAASAFLEEHSIIIHEKGAPPPCLSLKMCVIIRLWLV